MMQSPPTLQSWVEIVAPAHCSTDGYDGGSFLFHFEFPTRTYVSIRNGRRRDIIHLN